MCKTNPKFCTKYMQQLKKTKQMKNKLMKMKMKTTFSNKFSGIVKDIPTSTATTKAKNNNQPTTTPIIGTNPKTLKIDSNTKTIANLFTTQPSLAKAKPYSTKTTHNTKLQLPLLTNTFIRTVNKLHLKTTQKVFSPYSSLTGLRKTAAAKTQRFKIISTTMTTPYSALQPTKRNLLQVKMEKRELDMIKLRLLYSIKSHHWKNLGSKLVIT